MLCDIRLILIALALPHIRRPSGASDALPVPNGIETRAGVAYTLAPISVRRVETRRTVEGVRRDRFGIERTYTAHMVTVAEEYDVPEGAVPFAALPAHRGDVRVEAVDAAGAVQAARERVIAGRSRMPASRVKSAPTVRVAPKSTEIDGGLPRIARPAVADECGRAVRLTTARDVSRDVGLRQANRRARGEERRVKRAGRRTFAVKTHPTRGVRLKHTSPRGFGLASFVGATRFGPQHAWLARLDAIARSSK